MSGDLTVRNIAGIIEDLEAFRDKANLSQDEIDDLNVIIANLGETGMVLKGLLAILQQEIEKNA